MEKFKKISLLLFLSFLLSLNSGVAREKIELPIGDKVTILSDKAFRQLEDNRFEAIGNVVITHLENSIYGEKATLLSDTGESEVVGNVRYVSPTMTLYGSRMQYNFKSSALVIENARLLSGNYIILGKKIEKNNPYELRATDAEYTTCRDCPESWSIFGRDVRVTFGQYIRIKHAYIKIGGVIVLYVPYIILPIKKNRETGLLFPKIGFSLDEGLKFEQPWFWNLSQSNDLTFTPAFWGKRGLGGSLQYRHAIAEKTWFEFNTFSLLDRIYAPEKLNKDTTGNKVFRHFSSYEHGLIKGFNWNHHFYIDGARDLDILRDFDSKVSNRVLGPDIGAEGFFEYRNSLLNIGLEGAWRKNQLVKDAASFDDRYVQILPRISLSLVPYNLLQKDWMFLKKLSIGFESDFTSFKQNKVSEVSFIRNAKRFNVRPYVEAKLGRVGPVEFQTKGIFDYQYYDFPRENSEKSFTKSGFSYVAEAKVIINKKYGVAFVESVNSEELEDIEIEEVIDQKEKKGKILLGKLPDINDDYLKDRQVITKYSYRHSQEYKLKHYYLFDQRLSGSQKFAAQIENREGQFDPIDAIRSREIELRNGFSPTGLPITNTFEFQWNNTITRKTANSFSAFDDERYLRDNFSYTTVSYFNVSQGFKVDEESSKLEDKLTRLQISAGFSYKKFSFRTSENFFYATNDHLFSTSVSRSFSGGSFGVGVSYNSFATPITKTVNMNGSYQITALINLTGSYSFDFDNDSNERKDIGAFYSPLNQCWQLAVNYETSLIEKKYTASILINFDGSGFSSLTE